jgi:hypothetical protein
MELKGKVVRVESSWDPMYPVMAGDTPTGKARVEVELDGKAGRLCLNVPTKEAAEYPYGSTCTVIVAVTKLADESEA